MSKRAFKYGTVALVAFAAAMVMQLTSGANAAVHLDSGTSSGPANAFSDAAGHWAERYIADAVAQGYLHGFEDGTFRPDQPVTRAQFMKLVAAAIGKGAKLQDGAAWYMPYAQALQQEGIVDMEELPEEMNAPMTRAEMARVALRAVDRDMEGTIEEAVERGLLQGVGYGELEPDGLTTRAQACVIMERVRTLRSGGSLVPDKDALQTVWIHRIGSNAGVVFGLRDIFLPKDVPYDEALRVDVNRMIVLDYARGEAQPYGYLTKGLELQAGGDLLDVYVVAYQLTVRATEHADAKVRYDSSDLLGFVRSGNIIEASHAAYDALHMFSLGPKQQLKMWKFYALEKTAVHERMAADGKLQPQYLKIGNVEYVTAK